MERRYIYISSPCAGDMERNIAKARGYCRDVIERWPDIVPIAPHVYFTQFTDESIPEERAHGMEMGLALLGLCDELWVYGMDNPSAGMKREIEYAKEHGIPVRDAADVYGEEHGAEDNQ